MHVSLFAGDHVGEFDIGEFDTIANEVAKMADDGRRDKVGFDHVAHKQGRKSSERPCGLSCCPSWAWCGMGERDLAGLSRMLKTGIQYFPEDSM